MGSLQWFDRQGRAGRRRGAALLIAALSLASLVAVVYQESFVHSDDGCEVETHCLACRLAVAGAIDTPASAPALAAPREPRVCFVHRESGRPLDHAVRQVQSRGPPAA